MPTSADEVRAWATGLPGAHEVETWGHPTFRVGAKMFAGMAGDGSSLTVKAPPGDQTALVDRSPDVFFVPDYVGRHGWVGIILPLADPAEVHEMFTESWRRTAPKRVVRDYDAVG
jgi:hypothetical protein